MSSRKTSSGDSTIVLGGGVCSHLARKLKHLSAWRTGGGPADEESPLASLQEIKSYSTPELSQASSSLPLNRVRSFSARSLYQRIHEDHEPISVQLSFPAMVRTLFTKEYPLPASFVNNATLALRGSFFLLCLAVYKMTHDSIIRRTSIDKLLDNYYNGTAVIMFLFTYFRTTGETLSLAWNGVFGTFMGTFLMWIMFGIWPKGAARVSDEQATWRAGAELHIISGLAFTWLIFWLKFDLLTKIFASSTFVYLYMMFLNPTVDMTRYSTNFEIKYEGLAVEAFISTTVGCLLAVASCLVPTPIWATDQMKSRAVELQNLLGCAWSASSAWYDAQEKQPYQRDLLISTMRKIRETNYQLRELISVTWWECFGYGRTQKARILLQRFDERVKGCLDRLELVFLSCSEEDYGNTHKELMSRLDITLSEVTRTAGESFRFGVEAANQGGLADEAASKKAAELKEQTNLAVANLTKRFKEEVKKIGDDSELGAIWDLVDEHSVCACACSYGLIAQEFLADLQNFKAGDTADWVEGKWQLWAVFDGIFKSTAIVNAGRHTASIVVAFAIGWHGYSKMIPPYSAGIAVTVGILTNDNLIPSVSSSINRIVGLVFGTILGWMLWSLFGWCTTLCISVLHSILVLWVAGCLYCYFASNKYGTMGLLMGAFGAPAMMTQCSNDVLDPRLLYYKISDCSIAIVVVLFFDQLIQVTRPGPYAHYTFLKAWQKIEKRLVTTFDPDIKDVDFTDVQEDHKNITGKLFTARHLGSQAIDEPRLWRTTWEADAFDGVVTHTLCLRSTLNALERLVTTRPGERVATGNGDKRSKRDVFTHICAMPSFEAIKLVVLESLIKTRRNLDVFVHEVDTIFLSAEEKHGMDKDYINDTRRACMNFITKFKESVDEEDLKKWNDQPNYTLNSDAAALMCVVLTALKSIVIEVSAIDDMILQI